MSSKSERAIRRHGYMWKRTAAVAKAYTAGCATGFLTLLAAALVPAVGVSGYLRPALSPYLSLFLVLGLVLAIASGALAFLAGRTYLACERKARLVPYVAPVYKQTADIPAAEALLRGSNSPAAPAQDLLRSANDETETAAEQLLRPSG